MSKLTDTLQRMMARVENRAIAIRGGPSFAMDPDQTIGIATIKIVTEEQVQAIAYGPLDAPPAIIVRRNPLSRDVSDLMPFATYLRDWADRVSLAGGEGRVWTPHADAIDTIDILGHRYGYNDKAPEAVRRMGQVCRILAHEARFPGQQVVADAKQLLSEHAITGLSPAEEGHLGALLVWHDQSFPDKLQASRDAIRIPASGVLVNSPDIPDDEIVYFEAFDNYAFLYNARGEKKLCDYSLLFLEQRLDNTFARIHRKYIVNTNYIKEIRPHLNGRYLILFTTEALDAITSSKSYAAAIRRLIKIE